ncbi:putative ABC transporter ATP-binding protein NosF [Rhodovastum atsumiense]|uniref:ABC transporter ATP-binding protein n=1 Tax=Rhodovastum atsumiense TaxID=504468 RepID=A0A5M6IYS6_9PROT|nr:ABC transporter ATP-binding protein [Rhodovastum atsumiense]KAA5612535.1 ABC transporter ATP-binding protein [Rhodovastum atsumiense]CAH2601384.1 putative ABC transporter ATP-binding protein NosF [Rhodovastum atsumiense]
MNEATIRLDGVTKTFGRQVAVQDIDLVLHPGECVGLVGHNGAGKSTLIKLMLGLIRPSAGTVRTLGGDPAGAEAGRARAALGYLPENVAFQPAMTGAETLAFYARLKRQDVRANAGLLARVGLAGAARRRVGTYSKGMRQRLGLAQALLGQPRALLLDEPTSGLDPAARQEFYEILRALRDAGACVLLSSHALAELEGQVDRVVVMDRGRKMADGSLSALRRLAGIRPRLRIRLAEAPRAVVNGPDDWAGWSPLPGGLLETVCDEADLPGLLRDLPPEVTEVDIVRPSLDDVYAAFLRREGDA